jgi:hypothetical protein
MSTAVEAPGLEDPDPLQKEVDPKLLVSSGSRVILDVVTIRLTCLLDEG